MKKHRADSIALVICTYALIMVNIVLMILNIKMTGDFKWFMAVIPGVLTILGMFIVSNVLED